MDYDEEAQLTAALAAHEAKAASVIAKLAASNLDEKAAFTACLSAAKEQMSAFRALSRELEALAEEQNTDEGSQRLAVEVQKHHAQYISLQAAFVQANAQARQNMEAASLARRQQLLAASATGSPPTQASNSGAVAASQEITHSLQRTRQLMAQELEHTSATLAAMDTSNERLSQTRDELHTQRGLFRSSRKLLRALLTSVMLDNVSLYGGLALFFVVVAYILQKRTLYFAPLHRLAAPLLRSTPRFGSVLKPTLQALQPAGKAVGRVVRPVAAAAWNATTVLSSAAAAAATKPETWLACQRQMGRMRRLVVDAVSAARQRATLSSSNSRTSQTTRIPLQHERTQQQQHDGTITSAARSDKKLSWQENALRRQQERKQESKAAAPAATPDDESSAGIARLEAERLLLTQQAATAQLPKKDNDSQKQQPAFLMGDLNRNNTLPKQTAEGDREPLLLPQKAKASAALSTIAAAAGHTASPQPGNTSAGTEPLTAGKGDGAALEEPSHTPATRQLSEQQQQQQPEAVTDANRIQLETGDAIDGKGSEQSASIHDRLPSSDLPARGREDDGNVTSAVDISDGSTGPSQLQIADTMNSSANATVSDSKVPANSTPVQPKNSTDVDDGNSSDTTTGAASQAVLPKEPHLESGAANTEAPVTDRVRVRETHVDLSKRNETSEVNAADGAKEAPNEDSAVPSTGTPEAMLITGNDTSIDSATAIVRGAPVAATPRTGEGSGAAPVDSQRPAEEQPQQLSTSKYDLLSKQRVDPQVAAKEAVSASSTSTEALSLEESPVPKEALVSSASLETAAAAARSLLEPAAEKSVKETPSPAASLLPAAAADEKALLDDSVEASAALSTSAAAKQDSADGVPFQAAISLPPDSVPEKEFVLGAPTRGIEEQPVAATAGQATTSPTLGAAAEDKSAQDPPAQSATLLSLRTAAEDNPLLDNIARAATPLSPAATTEEEAVLDTPTQAATSLPDSEKKPADSTSMGGATFLPPVTTGETAAPGHPASMADSLSISEGGLPSHTTTGATAPDAMQPPITAQSVVGPMTAIKQPLTEAAVAANPPGTGLMDSSPQSAEVPGDTAADGSKRGNADTASDKTTPVIKVVLPPNGAAATAEDSEQDPRTMAAVDDGGKKLRDEPASQKNSLEQPEDAATQQPSVTLASDAAPQYPEQDQPHEQPQSVASESLLMASSQDISAGEAGVPPTDDSPDAQQRVAVAAAVAAYVARRPGGNAGNSGYEWRWNETARRYQLFAKESNELLYTNQPVKQAKKSADAEPRRPQPSAEPIRDEL